MKALLWVVSVFLLLGLIVYVAANVRAGGALERELAAIKAKGEPVSLAEIAPPPVPPAQNAALVYQKAFAAMPKLSGKEQKLLSDFSGGRKEFSPKETASLRAVIEKNQEALILIKEAAAMPRARFPVDWEAGYRATFPHYAHLRNAARLLAAEARLLARSGRTDEAYQDDKALLQLARSIGGEPVMIAALVQYAILSFAFDLTRDLLQIAPPSEATASELRRAIDELDLYESYARAMEGERVFGIEAFNTLRRNPDEIGPLMETGEGQPSIAANPVYRSLGSPLMKYDELAYLRYMNPLVERAKSRDLSSIHVEGDSPDRPIDEDKHFPAYAVITRTLAPVFTRAARKRDAAAARLRLMEDALALEDYRRSYASYPERLDPALAGREAGVDPLSGEPIKYQKLPNGYKLYSVGENGEDESGVNERRAARGTRRDTRSLADDIAVVVAR